MSRVIERAMKFEPAVLENVPLLIGLSGPPGGGKTYSSLLLARGIQSVRGGAIRVIDTEGGRSRKYANDFSFEVLELDHPRGNVLEAALREAVADSPAAVIIDTLSDEHEELLVWKEEETDRILSDEERDNERARDRVAMSAWRKPKQARRDLRNFMMRIRVPLICNFRAEEKTRPIPTKKDGGRMVAVPTNLGWQPVAPTMFTHLMDVLCLLPLRAEGRPLWKTTGNEHADFALKLPGPLQPMFPVNDKGEYPLLAPSQGAALALWAQGREWGPEQDELLGEAQNVATRGMAEFRSWWARLDPEKRAWLRQHADKLTDAARLADTDQHKVERTQ